MSKSEGHCEVMKPIIHQNETWPIQPSLGSLPGSKRSYRRSNLGIDEKKLCHFGKIKKNASRFFFFFKTVKSALKELQEKKKKVYIRASKL